MRQNCLAVWLRASTGAPSRARSWASRRGRRLRAISRSTCAKLVSVDARGRPVLQPHLATKSATCVDTTRCEQHARPDSKCRVQGTIRTSREATGQDQLCLRTSQAVYDAGLHATRDAKSDRSQPLAKPTKIMLTISSGGNDVAAILPLYQTRVEAKHDNRARHAGSVGLTLGAGPARAPASPPRCSAGSDD